VRGGNGDLEALGGILHVRGGFVRLLRVLASLGLIASRGGGVARMERMSKIEDGGSKIERGGAKSALQKDVG